MLPRRRTWITCLLAAGCLVVLVCFRMPERQALQSALDLAAMREVSRLGEGFLVWERKAGDEWQIWTKKLDGTGGEERLVPAEEGRDHFCPKISPDGRRLAYMSYARGETPYEAGHGVLWLLDLATRERTMLCEKARSYRENRAVMWFDNQRLCHVDEHGHGVELDLATGTRTVLTKTPHKHGWLVNPQKTHATSGDPEFAPMAPDGSVQAQPRHGGCQPYFSRDGRWGFWMGGAGGPMNKMFLPTRAVGQILDLNDPRMPRERNYLYFPMLSVCQRLMTFAASSDDHDHFESDYDIFVVRVDPGTLEPVGTPVRYTAFEGNDRFPDVYCREFPLGTHFVEGPSQAELRAPDHQPCEWQVNGSPQGTTAAFRHHYEREGDHWITAKGKDGVELRGLVHVRAARAPSLTLVRRVAERTLSLTFDESVSFESATASAGNDVKLKWTTAQNSENRVALLQLPAEVGPGALISLNGVRDLAQRPNGMPATTFQVPGAAWPQTRDGLLLAWEDRATVLDGMEPVMPMRSGKAFWSSRGGMDMRGGTFELPGAGTAMLRECGRSGAFTLEAIITPMVPPFDKAMRPVLSLEDDAGNLKLAILQLRSAWSLWLATEDNPRGTSIEQPLTPIRTGQPHHIVLGYQDGRFQLFVNGAQLWVRSQLKGRLKWDTVPGKLRIGSCSKLEGSWLGMVDQFALHGRLLTPTEAIAHADYAAPKLEAQRAVKTQKVVARLVQASRAPGLEDIRPYREALVEHLYEVLPNDKGDTGQSFPVGTRIAVAHWVWVNGESSAPPPEKVGETFRLFVEPREAHKELSSLVVRSDAPDFAAPSLLDVSNW